MHIVPLQRYGRRSRVVLDRPRLKRSDFQIVEKARKSPDPQGTATLRIGPYASIQFLSADEAGIAKARGGSLEIAQGAETRSFSVLLDTIEQVLHQHVQDVERVILCGSLQLVGKRQEPGARWHGPNVCRRVGTV